MVIYFLAVLSCRQLRKCFKEDIVRDVLTSSTAQEELEAEWQQLREDRDALRGIFPTGNSKVGDFISFMIVLVHIISVT